MEYAGASAMPEPKWTKAKDGWHTCNECDSRDASGQRRPYRCRTTNPEGFTLCDAREKIK